MGQKKKKNQLRDQKTYGHLGKKKNLYIYNI